MLWENNADIETNTDKVSEAVDKVNIEVSEREDAAFKYLFKRT